MASITTRSGKGSPLTHAEVDANFTNLNTDKLDVAGIALGTAASPTVKFTGDTNTGLYSPGADQISISTGGTERFRIDNNGQLEAVSLGSAASPTYTFTTDPDTGIYSPGANQVALATGGTGRLFVDSTGNVGINTPTPSGLVHGYINANAQLIFTNTQQNNLYLSGTNATFVADATGSSFPGFSLKVAGALVGQFTSNGTSSLDIASGTTSTPILLKQSTVERARIDSNGRVGIGTPSPSSTLHIKGNSSNASAIIHLQPDNNTVSNYITFRSATDTTRGYLEYNYVNDYLAFATTAGNERARIDSSGRLLVGTSTANTNGGILQLSSGITFPAAQVASADPNTLDDYEEGTWTPVLRGSGTAGTYELSRAIGIYTKVGRQVTLTMSIQLAGTITGGGTGYAQITGLPFQQVVNSFPVSVCWTTGVDVSTNYTSVFFKPIAAASTSTWYFSEVGDNVASSDLPIAAFSTGDTVEVTVNYIA